jgi:hypothetical protein
LYRTRYAGFTAKHFHEHLVKDHLFGWGYTWTKKLALIALLVDMVPFRLPRGSWR